MAKAARNGRKDAKQFARHKTFAQRGRSCRSRLQIQEKMTAEIANCLKRAQTVWHCGGDRSDTSLYDDEKSDQLVLHAKTLS